MSALEQQAVAELEAELAHPLAKVLPMGGTPAAPDWIIPGVVEAGVITIAGARGAGKTTAVYPLACAAAGIHEPGYSLAPKSGRWRHVLYVSEHPAQLQRIAMGLAHHLGITVEEIGQRVHLVEAVRMAASYLVEVGQHYREQFTRRVDGVELLPLVVLDTQAATIALENENDNAEASAAIAALKQRFEGLPVWIIAHVAKGDLNRRNAHELTARGAGAIESDAVGCLYLVKDGDGHDADRWLVLGKHRFEATRHEWRLDSGSLEVQARNAWGEIEPTRVRWAIARPDKPRAVAVAEAKDAARDAEATELRRCITAMVAQAWRDGEPLNRAALKRKLGGRAQTVADAIADLVDAAELYEVPIPAKVRTHPRRDAFLIRLTEEERDHLKATGEPPQVEIPPAWRKADSGTVGNDCPEPERENELVSIVPDSIVPLRETTRECMDGATESPPSCSTFLNAGTVGNDWERLGTDAPDDDALVATLCARFGGAA